MTMQTQWPRFSNGPMRFLRDESATTAIEYALIASVVSIAILGSVAAVGSALMENFYNRVVGALEEAAPP
jgi:pilus assembly protein Flp/PilA